MSGAPQAGGGVNQDEAGIVNNVVTALQPQIAEAVAAALRGKLARTIFKLNSYKLVPFKSFRFLTRFYNGKHKYLSNYRQFQEI